MSEFNDFEREYGPPQDCLSPDDAAIEGYQGRLPAKLLDLWREHGWCSWGDSLLWTVDPAQLTDVLEEWQGLDQGEALVFLRTSFAHLYFWRDGWVYSLDVHHGSLSQVTSDIALMFTLLCDPEIKEKILRAPLHEEAKKRLGPVGRDECYAFEPALAFGGSGRPETIRRVKIREQLGILAQLTN